MIRMTLEEKKRTGFAWCMQLFEPCSPYGAERLRTLSPYAPEEKDALVRELDNLQALVDGYHSHKKEIEELRLCFMRVKHIDKTLRTAIERALSDVELFAIKQFLLVTERARNTQQKLTEALNLQNLEFRDTGAALNLLDPEHTRIPSFAVYDAYSETLADIRAKKRALEREMEQAADKESYNAAKEERADYVTREEEEERLIRTRLTEALQPYIEDIRENGRVCADLDLLLEKARIATEKRLVKPVLSNDTLVLEEALHPEVAHLLEEKGRTFTPVSLTMGRGCTLITGANMGGKSVALNTVICNTMLALCGCFVFAKHMEVPLFKNLCLITEDEQSTKRGLSSFGAEVVRMKETAETVMQSFAFVVLDEFARGTNPEEGAALVRAVTTWLSSQQAISLVVTHYDGVAKCATKHYRVRGLQEMDFERTAQEIKAGGGDGVSVIASHMNYGLREADKDEKVVSEARTVCRLLGLQEEIMENWT